jgi:hypothetical protein
MTTNTEITDGSQIVDYAKETASLVHDVLPSVKKLRAFRDVTFFTLSEKLGEVGETKDQEVITNFFTEVLYEKMTSDDELMGEATDTLLTVNNNWNERADNNKMLELLFLIHLTLEIQEVIHGRILKAKNEGNPKAHTMFASFRVEANMVVRTLDTLQDRLLA